MLKGAIDIMRANMTSLSHVFKLETAVMSMLRRTSSFFKVLEVILSGRLSLGLVNMDSVKKEFSDFIEACSAVGFRPLFDNHNQIFKLPASFVGEDGIVQVLISLPLIPIASRTHLCCISTGNYQFFCLDTSLNYRVIQT